MKKATPEPEKPTLDEIIDKWKEDINNMDIDLDLDSLNIEFDDNLKGLDINLDLNLDHETLTDIDFASPIDCRGKALNKRTRGRQK